MKIDDAKKRLKRKAEFLRQVSASADTTLGRDIPKYEADAIDAVLDDHARQGRLVKALAEGRIYQRFGEWFTVGADGGDLPFATMDEAFEWFEANGGRG